MLDFNIFTIWNISKSSYGKSRTPLASGARLPCTVSIAQHPSGTYGPANRRRPLHNYGTDKPIEPQQLPLGRFHSFPVLPFKLKWHWNKHIFDPSRKSFGALCLIELKPWENDVFISLYDNAGLMAGTQRFGVSVLLLFQMYLDIFVLESEWKQGLWFSCTAEVPINCMHDIKKKYSGRGRGSTILPVPK